LQPIGPIADTELTKLQVFPAILKVIALVSGVKAYTLVELIALGFLGSSISVTEVTCTKSACAVTDSSIEATNRVFLIAFSLFFWRKWNGLSNKIFVAATRQQ